MKSVSFLQVGLLLIVVCIAAVYSLLSLYLQARQQHISISFELCTQAARLGNCARNTGSQVVVCEISLMIHIKGEVVSACGCLIKTQLKYLLQPNELSYDMSGPLIAAASLSCLSPELPDTQLRPEPFTLADIVRDRPPQ